VYPDFLPNVTWTSPEAASGRRPTWIECARPRLAARPDAFTRHARRFGRDWCLSARRPSGKTFPARRPWQRGADSGSPFESGGIGCGACPGCFAEAA